MKLYFYVLNTYSKNVSFEASECDVVEHPKTYKPKTKFPNGIYRSYISKKDINKISGYSSDVVILLQPNAQRAKELFLDLHNLKIEHLRQSLSKEEKIVEAIKKMQEEQK